MKRGVCDRGNGFPYFPFGTMNCQRRSKHRGRHRAVRYIHEFGRKHKITVEWYGKIHTLR